MTQQPDSINSDLTAKARIRNAALELFARYGVAATPMRAISDRAGVTVGLITHHFGTKAKLQDAVEENIIQGMSTAIQYSPQVASAHSGVVPTLNQRLRDFMGNNPHMLDYLRRTILMEPHAKSRRILQKLVELTYEQLDTLRTHGVACTKRSVVEQARVVLLGQLGPLFLQPFTEGVSEELGLAPAPIAIIGRPKD